MSATDIGVNFRESSGFVTDGTDETYCLGTDTYPTTRGGWTFGFSVAPGTSNDFDSDAGNDRRLAGSVRWGTQTWRLDLPATGNYTVHAAIGSDNNTSNERAYSDIRDSTTVLATIGSDAAAAGAESWYDATEVLRTPDTDWVSNEQPMTWAFATTQLIVTRPADGTGSRNHVSHIRAIQQAGAAGARRLVPGVIIGGNLVGGVLAR